MIRSWFALGFLGGLLLFLSPFPLAGKGPKRSWTAPPEARELKNPVPADAASLSMGKDLYEEHCLMCHGEKGKGDGPMADTLPRSPGDLTQARDLTDGELFWRISKGDDVMPSFETEKPLSEEDRWHLVNFIRTFSGSGGK